MNFLELLQKNESDYLDFKEKWHEDTADLILDILCMANSDAQSDRYLVFGVCDKSKNICDISNNRRKRDDISDILSNANFNRIPDFHIETIVVSNKEIDILVIRKTNHRPYFLLKDKPFKGKNKVVRAGVIYTRNSSVNTPHNGTASENQIADMWRERFGLNLSPQERLNIYVRDWEAWEQTYDEEKRIKVWHYKQFPEFTIEYYLPENMSDYSPHERADVVFANSIGNSYETTIKYKYHSTVIKNESLYICDKCRYLLLHPHADWLYYNPKDFADTHVFVNNSNISDRGKSIKEIDYNAKAGGQHNQVTFFYNIEDSFIYCVQKILNYNSIYNIYKDYSFSYEGCCNSEENKDIICPNKILLIEQNQNIADKLRAEFENLQQKKKTIKYRNC